MTAENHWEVRRLQPEEAGRWEKFSLEARAPNGFERNIHEALTATFPWEIEYWVAEQSGEIVAGVPLVRQSSVLGKFITSIPCFNYAGVWGVNEDACTRLAAAIVGQARDQRCDRLELRQSSAVQQIQTVEQSKSRFLLPLPNDADALLASFKSKVRSQVNRCKREGYEVRMGNSQDVGQFWKLLSNRWHQLGTPIIPLKFFQALKQKTDDRSQLVFVHKEGEDVAAGWLLKHRGSVEIPWAASNDAHDRFGVNMLLYWGAFETAVRLGANEFDFGRSTPGSGHAKFKLQWGAREEPLAWIVWSSKDQATEAADRSKVGGRNLMSKAWRKLPLSFANWLGPKLAPYIPY